MTPLARPFPYAAHLDRKEGRMSSKRQQTMAKLTRERKVKERRELKLEKKQVTAAERAAARAGENPPPADTAD
jgi:hypothetical protein